MEHRYKNITNTASNLFIWIDSSFEIYRKILQLVESMALNCLMQKSVTESIQVVYSSIAIKSSLKFWKKIDGLYVYINGKNWKENASASKL